MLLFVLSEDIKNINKLNSILIMSVGVKRGVYMAHTHTQIVTRPYKFTSAIFLTFKGF